MKQNIENIIKSNRADFDCAELPDGHASRFAERLDGTDTKSDLRKRNSPGLRSIILAAMASAAVLFFVVTIALSHRTAGSDSYSGVAEVQQYYTMLLEEQAAELLAELGYVDENARVELAADIIKMTDLGLDDAECRDMSDNERIALIYRKYTAHCESLEHMCVLIHKISVYAIESVCKSHKTNKL